MNALVTGGGRGIGRAIALRLAKDGSRVAIAARSADELAETAALAGSGVTSFTADVADPEAAEALVRDVEAKVGPLDLLVNNAGITGPMAPLWECDPAEWWRCQEVNLRAPMVLCHAVVPGMIARGRGRIVNVSSGAGLRTVPNFGAYVVSKTALIRFSEQLAFELAPHGVQVFPISPGVVRTNMVEQVRHRVAAVQSYLDEGRDVAPEAAAELVAFLASGRADALSGRLFSVGRDWEQMLHEAGRVRAESLYMLSLREL
jgi:3-oxoacyl-[acyl-carrier protein] reductase